MRKTVFILGAGHALRTGGRPKFLMRVDDTNTSLLKRMVLQINGRARVHLAIRDPAYNSFGFKPDPIPVVARDSRCTCESLVACRNYMNGRVIVLLGDVYYTDKTMEDILSNTSPFCIWTDKQDIFAMAFYRACPIMESAWVVANQPIIRNNGRLWEAYRHMIREDGTGIPTLVEGMVRYVCDETQDFDTHDDYTNFRKGKTKNQLLKQSQDKPVAQQKGDDLLRMRQRGNAKKARRLLEMRALRPA